MTANSSSRSPEPAGTDDEKQAAASSVQPDAPGTASGEQAATQSEQSEQQAGQQAEQQTAADPGTADMDVEREPPAEAEPDPVAEAIMSAATAMPADPPSGPAATMSPASEAPEAETDRLAMENQALKEQVLRLMADMENLRRRTEREKNDITKYAVSKFARDLLSVTDNMDRAIEAVPADADTDDTVLQTLIEGVKMTRREMLNMLERHGISPLDPLNGRFDPNVHQAMFEIENDQVPSGTVLQVLQPGFLIGDRVLRPALVGVSKGGPKLSKDEHDQVLADAAVADAVSDNEAATSETGAAETTVADADPADHSSPQTPDAPPPSDEPPATGTA